MNKNIPELRNDINPYTRKSYQVANEINENNKSKQREKDFYLQMKDNLINRKQP